MRGVPAKPVAEGTPRSAALRVADTQWRLCAAWCDSPYPKRRPRIESVQSCPVTVVSGHVCFGPNGL